MTSQRDWPNKIQASPDLDVVIPPALNVVTFRHRAGDDINRAIPDVLDPLGTVFLRGTAVQGQETLRACFMNPATTTDDVDQIVPAVHQAANQLIDR